jgi:hypothetical protein
MNYVAECSYPSKGKGNSDVQCWFEILKVDHAIVLLVCGPHGIDYFLDILVRKEALPLSLCGTHFLADRLAL